MKFTITEKRKNELLGRTEVKGNIEFKGATPSNLDVVNAIVKNMKIESNVVVMRTIKTAFGTQTAKFNAFVYESLDKKEHIEKKTKHIKKLEEERKKKEEEERKASEEAKKKAEEEAVAKETTENKKTEESSEENPTNEEKKEE